MRFEHSGKSLWYGTPDAPAPEGVVVAGAQHTAAGVAVTVGVQPLNASYRVDVHYRINGGAATRIPAVLFRTDVRAGSQYFSARLPDLKAGDKVDYGAVCACGNVQVPQPGPPHVLPTSFHVVGPVEAQQHIAARVAQSAATHAVPAPSAARANGAHPVAAQTTLHPAAAQHTAQQGGAHHPPTHPAAGHTPPRAHPQGGQGSHIVEGIVSSPGRGALAGMHVEIVDKNAGPHVSLASATTDQRGHYRASYNPPAKKTNADICARIFAGQALLGVSAVRYNARTRETLPVVIPPGAHGLPSEYESITAALAKEHVTRAGELRESDERDDIGYLAKKTGWDARAIAYLALADRLAHGKASSGPTLQPQFLYALFRAGFPVEPGALFGATVEAVTEAWQLAIQHDILPESAHTSVPAAAKTFETLSALHALEEPPAVGLSNLKDLLQVTLGSDPQRQRTFAELHVRHKNDLPEFWSHIEKSFGAELTRRLQLDGQLAHLTLNNAPLLSALHHAQTKPPLTSVDDLAWRGFYQAHSWAALVGTAIPKEITGHTLEERRLKYSEYLGAQVRLSSPTVVVAAMVGSGALTLSKNATAADKTALQAFFHEHSGRFSLGGDPVERFLAHNLSKAYSRGVVAEIKRLQRVYQITPNDHAFATLLHHDLDSAYAVTRYDPEGFARAFGKELGGAPIAHQIHAKARVVAGAALQIATARLAARGAHTSVAALRPWGGEQPPQGPLVASPTLEQLFGSMDFCDCSECRSILGPAAYLVDLLNFIDYPPAGKRNPQTLLLARRPDLQYLPLTCENTNVALPYLDLVNETLEYFVTNQLTLAGYRGHTTDGSIPSETLMADPQFVQESAYATLRSALFPPPLPFDRSLELTRAYFDAMGTSLYTVMEALLPDRPGEHAARGYSSSDILFERIGLSRMEHQLLTDGTLTVEQIHGLPASAAHSREGHHVVALKSAKEHPPAPAALQQPRRFEELSNVQVYSRRLGVSYEQLAAVVRTDFINPNTSLAARVEALQISFEAIQALGAGTIDDGAFTELLPVGLDPVAYGAHPAAQKSDYGPVIAWLKDETRFRQIMDLITIAKAPGSDDVCSAANLRLCYANPDPDRHELRAIDFVRLLRFIRLWRKLELTIDHTDAVISALFPAATAPGGGDEASDLKRLDEGFKVLLARIGFLWQVLDLLALSRDRDIPALLACWAPIGTHGAKSLYARMFLSPEMLRQDPVFAIDPSGKVLVSGGKLFDHEPSLRSACHLTGPEFEVIAAALGFSADTELTLDNVSAVYRRGWLARTLRLSVVELLALIRCTGLDPFAPLDEAQHDGSQQREPPMVRFVRLVQALRAASLKPAQALYVFWNQDLSGKAAPGVDVVTGLARALRVETIGVERQFSLVDDPDGAMTKGLMNLAYGAEVTNFFFSLLEGSITVSVAYAHAQPPFPEGLLSAGGGRLAYDDLRKVLTYSGVLDEHGPLGALKAAAAGSEPLLAALAALEKASHRSVDPFFVSHPALQPLYATYVTSTETPLARRRALLAGLLPDLKRQRIEDQALGVVIAASGADPSFAPALLRDARVLAAATDATRPALADLTAANSFGLTARFFGGNDLAAAPEVTVDAAGDLSYGQGAAANVLPAGGGGGLTAATWTGWLEAPANGFYNLSLTADPGATVDLEIDGSPVVLARAGEVWSNQTQLSWRAGALVPIALKIANLKGSLAVRWTTTGLPWQIIPAASLYSASLLQLLRTTYVRFIKAASLAGALSISANELAYLAAAKDLFVGGHPWLNGLADSHTDPTAARGLTSVLSAVLGFARIKAALSASDEGLLTVLRNPDETLPGGGSALLALTRWEKSSLAGLLTHLFGDASTARLGNVATFRQVYDAYTLADSCGISIAALIKTTTNDPTANDAASLRSALRARYAESDWLTLSKPINDKIRARQRDALVAFSLHHLATRPATRGIDTPERLSEYLLMDIEMAPCAQTSRIRLALSSIQLFIERTLRSLEPEVDPTHISSDQWEWMKRYRIWQANREVFLWPENWLDPDLRVDQSAIFKETLGELLQSDITDTGATNALLGYLAKLHDVAKLEPCGVCHVPAHPGMDNALTHVIARSAGSKRKYHYRRHENGGWTAWEEIKLNIDAGPVVPVLWNDRLLLLWLQIIKQAPPPEPPADDSPPPKPKPLKFEEFIHWSKADWAEWQASVNRYDAYQKKHGTSSEPKKLTDADVTDLHASAKSGAGDPVITVQAVLCYSEYHGGKWQPANTSDVNTPTVLGAFAPHGHGAFDPSRLRLRTSALPQGQLLVHLSLDSELDRPGAGFLLYNTHSVPHEMAGIPSEMLHSHAAQRLAYSTSSALKIDYRGATRFTRDILHTQIAGRAIEVQPGLQDAWEAPFLYEDARNVFFVTTEEAHEPLHAFKGFGFAHPSGVAHAGVALHFPRIAAPHQPKIVHTVASTSSLVPYDGHWIGATGRLDTHPHSAGSGARR